MSDKSIPNLGKLPEDAARRDAIHIAVAPCIAGDTLLPGAHVGFLEEGTVATYANKLIGVVDPYLTAEVERGEKVWVLLYPNTITSLCHEWTHPDFPDAEPSLGVGEKGVPSLKLEAKSKAEAWIRDYANDLGIDFDKLVDGAADWVHTHDGKYGGDYLVDGGTLEGETTAPEFWDHYAIYAGVEVPDEAKTNFFSCSC